MKSRLPALLAALAGCFFAGCLPESKNPLSAPAASVVDTRIGGVYLQRDEDHAEGSIYWHFRFRPDTRRLEVVSVDHQKDGKLATTRFEALAARLGGQGYFSFREVREAGGKEPRPYSFARYEVDWRAELRVWLIDGKALTAAIKAGQLQGKITPGKFVDRIELTAPTARLAAFVAEEDPKTLFNGQPLVLRRLAR